MKKTEFAEKENRNPRLSIEAWLDKYIFTDEHEIFFASLSGELHEWLSKLAETKCYTQSDKPAEWTLLTGEKIPHNKGGHCPFRKSQLDSRTFGMAGPTGLWTRYHLGG